MNLYTVTTAQTVYETYTVSAETHEDARIAVLDDETRANLTSWPDGDNDDLMVIDSRVVSDI